MESDAPFTNREIREMFRDMTEGLGRVEDQTKKTNGRVTSLEKWMYTCVGGLTVISIVLIPLFTWMLNSVSDMDTRIQQAVDDALSAYNIE